MLWDNDRNRPIYNLPVIQTGSLKLPAGLGLFSSFASASWITDPTVLRGGAGPDTFNVSGGNFVVLAGNGANKVTTGDGNDFIWSKAGADIINAGSGNNIVLAGDGANQVVTGSGCDLIVTGSGNDRIDAGDGNNFIDAGCGNDTIRTGSGRDFIDAGSGNDTVWSGAGNDVICAGTGDDRVYAGAGNDIVDGGDGNDTLYGDGPPELSRVALGFADPTIWTPQLNAAATRLSAPGLTIDAHGGTLSAFHGLSVASPSDPSVEAWTKEIDGYNDAPESLTLTFATDQSGVVLHLGQFYIENGFVLAPELADITVHLADGTSLDLEIAATDRINGLLDVSIGAALTGGKLVHSIDIAPSPALPAGVPPAYEGSYAATHPFSEFTLLGVDFDRDVGLTSTDDDILYGGAGCDYLDGGRGDDWLFGGSGRDTLIGGSGNNHLDGGCDADTFVFGATATGHNDIDDFRYREDHLKFTDGVTVTGASGSGDDLILSLSTGGTVVLDHMRYYDWHGLI